MISDRAGRVAPTGPEAARKGDRVSRVKWSRVRVPGGLGEPLASGVLSRPRLGVGDALWALAIGALLAAGCAAPRLGDGYVIEAERLPEAAEGCRRAGRPLIALDLRSREEFVRGHLRGARWVDREAWVRGSERAPEGPEDPGYWRSRFGDVGVTGDDPVVVYDGGEMTEAARVWFLFQQVGGSRAAIVNGGWPALQSSLPESWEAGEPPAVAPRTFEAPRLGSRPAVGLARKRDVRSADASGTASVLDVRTRAEYVGADARGNPRTGHVPSAVSLPHKELLDERGRLRPAYELRHILEEAGVPPGRALITHCQSGGRAALAALAAARAGYARVDSYYRSFAEWASDGDCPIAPPASAQPRP